MMMILYCMYSLFKYTYVIYVIEDAAFCQVSERS